MWGSEKNFSEYIRAKLRAAGFLCQRIESGSTGLGIPDMYVQGHGTDYWIETKFMRRAYPTGEAKVSWRGGQQAWAKEYAQHHVQIHSRPAATFMHKFTWTAVGFNDGTFAFIKMNKLFSSNIVDFAHDAAVYYVEANKHQSLGTFLKKDSVSFKPRILPRDTPYTYRQYILDAAYAYAIQWFHVDASYFDIDPDVIYSEVTMKVETITSSDKYVFDAIDSPIDWQYKSDALVRAWFRRSLRYVLWDIMHTELHNGVNG